MLSIYFESIFLTLSILVFDTNTHQAISMATIGDIPPARYSFSTVNAPDGRSLVLFGGQSTSSETLNATNDVYLLDTCTLNWTQVNTRGSPPVARAGHEAISYNNRYMIVMMGIQDYIASVGPVYTNSTAILDMESWKWVSEISSSSTYQNNDPPGCRFTFPVVIPNGDDGNGGDDNNNNNGNDGNATVVSGSSSSSTTKKLAFGITFGVLGFLLLTTGAIIFIFRIRRDVDAKNNPRWLPNVLKKKKSSSNQETYPLSINS